MLYEAFFDELEKISTGLSKELLMRAAKKARKHADTLRAVTAYDLREGFKPRSWNMWRQATRTRQARAFEAAAATARPRSMR